MSSERLPGPASAPGREWDAAGWALRRAAEGLEIRPGDVERLEERYEGTRQLGGLARSPARRQSLLLALAAVLSISVSLVALASAHDAAGRVSVLSAARPTGSVGAAAPADLDDLTGLWRVEEGAAWPPLWVLRADGTFEVLRARNLLGDPPALGTVAVQPPDGLTLTDASGCAASFRAEHPAADRLRLHWLTADGGCRGDLGPEPAWVDSDLTRVAPTAETVVSRYAGGWPGRLRWESGLDGVWLLQGVGRDQGRLLVVDRLRYAVLDDLTAWSASGGRRFVEQGVVRSWSRGRVELRPAGLACPRVYRVWTDYATLDARLQETSCGRIGGAADTWVRLM